jgi:hypothetical protein
VKNILPSHLPFLKGIYALAVLLGLSCSLPSLAQVKVIEVDSVTRLPNQSIPFDEPFILKIPIKSQSVAGVTQIELINRAGLIETLERRLASGDFGFHPIPVDGYKVEPVGKVRYLTINYGTVYLSRKLNVFRAEKARRQAHSDWQQVEKEKGATSPEAIKAKIIAGKADSSAKHTKDEAGDNYYLSPGKSYAFLWSGDVSSEVWALFDQYRRYRTAPDTATANKELKEVRKTYAQLIDINKKAVGFNIYFVPSELSSSFSPTADHKNDTIRFKNSLAVWYKYQETKLVDRYTELEAAETLLKNKIDTLTLRFGPVASATHAYKRLNSLLIQESPEFDSGLKLSYASAPAKVTKRLMKLRILDKGAYERLLKGLESIDCDQCKQTQARQYEARLTNLKATIVALDELAAMANSFPTDSAVLNPAVKDLQNLRTNLRTVQPQLENTAKFRQALGISIAGLASSSLQIISGNTNVVGFETRNKLSIAPDFGLVTTRFTKEGRNNPYSFLPYLGFNVNLHPINRENYFRSYPHRISHYLSLSIGWTLVQIDNGPKQTYNLTQDSIRSYFKGKGTLLTGAGFRLGNAARITAGGVWYFQYKQDPATMTYTGRNLRAWPFVGLSLDMSLTTLLNGITDVFGVTPRAFTPKPIPPDQVSIAN